MYITKLNFILVFFNLIFNTGVIPDEWLAGIVKPIFKKKGTLRNPKTTVQLHSFVKLSRQALCKRLEIYVENLSLISECQTGFRKGYSTLDNILTLHVLMNLVMSAKKKLFCAFIDFKQAFDTVWRNRLWYKLLNNGISDKCLTFIRNIYNGIKSMVSINGQSSDF